MEKKKVMMILIGICLIVATLIPTTLAYIHEDTKDNDDELDYESVENNTGVHIIDSTDYTGSGDAAELLTILPQVGEYINGNEGTVPGGRWLEVDFNKVQWHDVTGSTNYPRLSYCWLRWNNGSGTSGWVNMTATSGWNAAVNGGDDAYLIVNDTTVSAGKWVTGGATVGHDFGNISTTVQFIEIRPLYWCDTNNADVKAGWYLTDTCTWYVKGYT